MDNLKQTKTKGIKKPSKVLESLKKKNKYIKSLEKKYKDTLSDYAETAEEHRSDVIRTKMWVKEATRRDAENFVKDYSPEWEYEDSAWEAWYLRGIEDSINDLKHIDKEPKKSFSVIPEEIDRISKLPAESEEKIKLSEKIKETIHNTENKEDLSKLKDNIKDMYYFDNIRRQFEIRDFYLLENKDKVIATEYAKDYKNDELNDVETIHDYITALDKKAYFGWKVDLNLVWTEDRVWFDIIHDTYIWERWFYVNIEYIEYLEDQDWSIEEVRDELHKIANRIKDHMEYIDNFKI